MTGTVSELIEEAFTSQSGLGTGGEIGDSGANRKKDMLLLRRDYIVTVSKDLLV